MKAQSFNTVINACAAVRDPARAERWFNKMEEDGVRPTQITYNIMVKAHSRNSNAAKAEWWFNEMARQGFNHNTRSVSSLATAYGQVHAVDIQKVERLVADMQEGNLHPTYDILISLMNCAAHTVPPRPDLAMAWFKIFMPQVRSVTQEQHRRHEILATLTATLCKAVPSADAEAAIQWAQQTCPKEWALTSTIAPSWTSRNPNTKGRHQHGRGRVAHTSTSSTLSQPPTRTMLRGPVFRDPVPHRGLVHIAGLGQPWQDAHMSGGMSYHLSGAGV